MTSRHMCILMGLVVGVVVGTPVLAQQEQLAAGERVARLVAEPARLSIEAGDTVDLAVSAFDAQGGRLSVAARFAFPRNALRVGFRPGDGRTGLNRSVTGLLAGEYEIVVTVVLPADSDAEPATARVAVSVSWPPVDRVEITADPGTLFQGTTLRHRAAAYHADGTQRPEAPVVWTSSDSAVASVDRFGQLTANSTGSVTLTAMIEGARSTVDYTVVPFPATRLEITGGLDDARTGDVLRFAPRATDANGDPVDGIPITWTLTFTPDDSINAPGASGQIVDGAFVGEVPGQYTVIASAGPLNARRTVDLRPRNIVREIELRGRGTVRETHSADLWVFEGRDGRDYAITGTWRASGKAYFWDVTDPTNIFKTDSIQVDARTINDVKVSPDGRYAALSREGASNRRNGVVILDLADPAHPRIASVYDDGLTGGVHNMFATDDYLFALSAGDKYIILDVRDIENPTYVSEYNHPDSRVHDVWVHDGIAYSAEWGNGVVVVDVGNGKWGGSIENPVFVTNVPYPVGRTHAVFPYFQEGTGKFYLFLGDEIMNRRGHPFVGLGGLNPYDPETGDGGIPSANSGYIHIIDFTDPMNPKDVARYQVTEFGTHNIWVEDDLLYQAYYEGGLRVVDVSGELMGNLAEQGREIAVFKAYDPLGYIPNAPMTWSAQPYKGHIFFSDLNSGLWAVRVMPKEQVMIP
ncbi:MAG: Ig-like domain-containing protein [Gemmatimonadetes bacterium]|nr:Ig-like domain-containing protein [Gemmatimonadota bacterium]